jgi:hypothetical protein
MRAFFFSLLAFAFVCASLSGIVTAQSVAIGVAVIRGASNTPAISGTVMFTQGNNEGDGTHDNGQKEGAEALSLWLRAACFLSRTVCFHRDDHGRTE